MSSFKKNDMRKRIFIIVLTLLSISLNAQLSSIVFFADNGINQHSSKAFISQDFVFQYNNFINLNGEHGSIVRKMSSNLEILDTLMMINPNSSIIISDIIEIDNGDFIIFGAREFEDIPDFYEIMLLKIDDSLNQLSETFFNMNTGIVDHTYHYIKENGNIAIASSVQGNPPNNITTYLDFLILEINQECELEFDSIFNYSSSEFVLDFIPVEGSYNSILLCTPNFEPGNDSKRFNVLDSNFNLINAQYIPEREYFMSIKELSDSNYLINSRKLDQDYSPTAWFAQQRLVDNGLNEVGINVFGSPDTMMYPAQYNSIGYQDDDNIYTSYTYNIDVTSYSSKQSFVCVSSIDNDLNQNWIKYYGGDAYYFVCDICPVMEGGCIITGTRYKNGSIGPFEREIFIMKVNEDGVVGTGEHQIPIKNAITTPNPGKNYFQLHTGIYPSQLQIFTINGQLVLEEDINENTTTINTQLLSSGIYVWQLIKDGEVVESDKWVKE